MAWTLDTYILLLVSRGRWPWPRSGGPKLLSCVVSLQTVTVSSHPCWPGDTLWRLLPPVASTKIRRYGVSSKSWNSAGKQSLHADQTFDYFRPVLRHSYAELELRNNVDGHGQQQSLWLSFVLRFHALFVFNLFLFFSLSLIISTAGGKRRVSKLRQWLFVSKCSRKQLLLSPGHTVQLLFPIHLSFWGLVVFLATNFRRANLRCQTGYNG